MVSLIAKGLVLFTTALIKLVEELDVFEAHRLQSCAHDPDAEYQQVSGYEDHDAGEDANNTGVNQSGKITDAPSGMCWVPLNRKWNSPSYW